MTTISRLLLATTLSLCPLCLTAQRNPSIKIGLSTNATEHVISLEGGGSVCNRAGKTLIQLRNGERLRIWLDTRGNVTTVDEYRIQIGPPLVKQEADALIQKIRRLGESPESIKWPDGDTWRVLLGSFATVEDADPLLQKLIGAGFDELWVTSEKKTVSARNSRGGLYGITEKYERIALPSDGVTLKPNHAISTIEGKGGYRGRIDIFPNAQNRLNVINTLDMESYLRGVVPKEMGAWAYPSIEALKAQAVAARTYAYANLGKRSKDGFDLLDTPADQVYGGKDGEQSLTDRAVEETKGLIATLNGRPIQALFMATGGGATVNNTHVFGGSFSYLQSASNYPDTPRTLPYRGITAPVDGGQSWLSWDIARMVAEGLLPASQLNTSAMSVAYRPEDLRQYTTFLTRRFKLPAPASPPAEGNQIYIWMSKALQFDRVTSGIERPLDASYFLQNAPVNAQDRILAGFLARRGIVSPLQWNAQRVTVLDALQALGRMWAELEPLDIQEGTLLLDGQVRPQRLGPTPLRLGTPLLLLEEYPGGYLRMVSEVSVQVGDRVKWLKQDGGSRLFVRRLDPDGASYDRYNAFAHWKTEMTEAELLASLRSRTAVRSFRSLELKHNENGRVIEMVVRDRDGASHRFTGMRIRGALGLRDNVFRYIATGEAPNRKFIFYGRGWGHGVGMDQTGAYGMSLEGYTFDQILKHYYKGITIQPMPN